MRLLAFDILGYMAHFRRVYTTTTSLSYSFPPRTSLAGIIAAILGMERDSHYRIMSSERAGISVSVLTPPRRLSFKLNYLFPKKGDNWEVSLSKLMGMEMKTQVITEFIVSEDLSPLRYRVLFTHESDRIMDELHSRLSEGRLPYPISLGTAYNLAYLEFIGDLDAEILNSDGEVVEMRTVLPLRSVQVELSPNLRVVLEERVPAELGEGRNPLRVEDYVYEERGNPLPVRPRMGEGYFLTRIREEEWRGMFL